MALELNVSKNTNEAIAGTYGKYYSRVEYKGTMDIKALAKHMAEHTTSFSKGEILGMLTDMASCIKELVLMGFVIKIDDLGLFKASVDSNGLTLASGSRISAGVGRQRKDEELQEDPTVQQFAVGAVKIIMQATGETAQDQMTREASLTFTSKSKALIKSLTGGEASDNGGGGGGNGHAENTENTENEPLMAPQITGQTPFAESTQVSIQGPQGAEIRYTVDGSTPTAESQLYSEAFSLSATATVKAIAIMNGESSQVSSKIFTKAESGDDDDYDTGS